MSEINKETLKIEGEKLVEKVKQLVKEGNVRKISIKDEDGKTLMEIPLTWAAVGVLAAPVVAAVGALAALLSNITLEIERDDAPAAAEASPSLDEASDAQPE